MKKRPPITYNICVRCGGKILMKDSIRFDSHGHAAHFRPGDCKTKKAKQRKEERDEDQAWK